MIGLFYWNEGRGIEVLRDLHPLSTTVRCYVKELRVDNQDEVRKTVRKNHTDQRSGRRILTGSKRWGSVEKKK